MRSMVYSLLCIKCAAGTV